MSALLRLSIFPDDDPYFENYLTDAFDQTFSIEG